MYRHIGWEEEFPKGTKVLVPKGTIVHSIRAGDLIETKRNMTVKIQALLRHGQQVCWAGAGGYWMYADKVDVMVWED